MKTSMSEALGFEGGVPASLLFVKATDKQVDLFMQEPFRVVGFLLTGTTFTVMEASGRHRRSLERMRLLYPKTRTCFLTRT